MTRVLLLVLLAADTILAQGLPRAFRDVAPADAALRDGSAGRTSRFRMVQPDPSLFDAASASDMIARGVALQVEFNLFEDTRFNVELERAEHVAIPRGALVWMGKLSGFEHSEVVLAVAGEVHTGVIRTGRGEVYRLRSVAGLLHEIEQVDVTRFPRGAQPKVADGAMPEAQSEALALSDDGSLIDVLVVYTAAAKAGAGGLAAMESLVAATIASTNQGYLNSGITQRLRLVGSSEIAYAETGLGDLDLDRLTSTTDGQLDSVHTLRNTTKADIVSLWVENSDVCGIAWLMKTSDFAGKAFNVVARECALEDLSFGHEVGHNMGAAHDVDNASGPGYYLYSFGYQQTITPPYFRTVMAYGCEFVYCPAINYYSSPANRYNGVPTGVSNSDNAATLNGTRNITSNFRQATVGSLTIQPPSYSVEAAQTSAFITVTAPAGVNWTAVSNSAWIVVTAGSTGSGSGTVTYRVDANPSSSLRSGVITIGGVLFTVTQAGIGATCSITPILVSQTVNATLSATDCISPLRSGVNARRYTFYGTAGLKVSIQATSSAFDTYVMLLGPSGVSLAEDDDSGGGTNSRIPSLGFFTLASAGIYTIEVSSFFTSAGGAFTLILTADAVPAPSANGPFRFVTLTPCRVADTRGNGFTGPFGAPRLTAGSTRVLPMRTSVCGIPADARAYSLNFTVVPQGPLGYLSTWPSDQPQPVVSTLNSPRGTILANAAIVPGAADGSISIFVSNDADVIVDINGYFAP